MTEMKKYILELKYKDPIDWVEKDNSIDFEAIDNETARYLAKEFCSKYPEDIISKTLRNEEGHDISLNKYRNDLLYEEKREALKTANFSDPR